MRKVSLVKNEYYHIYNRGVDKRDVFLDEKDYVRFLTGMREFNCEAPIGSLYLENLRKRKAIFRSSTPKKGVELQEDKIVDIICYCLNPNHYHFILAQLVDRGIEKFMQKLGTSHTNYFNERYKRSGALFQGRFKSTHIDSNELLFYLSAYVNCNSEVHGIEEAENYKWCSFLDYIGKRNGALCKKDIILDQLKGIEKYKIIAMEIAKDINKKREYEKFLME